LTTGAEADGRRDDDEIVITMAEETEEYSAKIRTGYEKLPVALRSAFASSTARSNCVEFQR
jgi:hypothetical protein